jgi:DNA-binding MarR family transcriptional regulator
MQELTRLAQIIELLRKQLNKDLPSQHIALLLAVAQQPGITMPELCEQLDMPQGTVSRNVKLMSHFCDKKGSNGVTKKGYGLLETDQAPSNRYQLAVFLTAEGERLVQKMARVMEHEQVIEDIRERMTADSGAFQKQRLS